MSRAAHIPDQLRALPSRMVRLRAWRCVASSLDGIPDCGEPDGSASDTVSRALPRSPPRGLCHRRWSGVEIAQIAAGTYRFTSGTVNDALPPPWLLAMWAQFATTFRFSLRRVISRPLSAAVFGAAGGPVAFLAGERMGAVTLLPPLTHGLLRLSVSWAISLLVLSAIVRRLSPEDAPRYRVAQ